MSLWRHLTRGLGVLVHRRTADEELSDEVQHYVEQSTAANLARGMSYDEARRAAQIEIGNATVVREEVRSHGWEHAIDTLAADVRYAGRRLRGQPGFTIVAALTLALGIGAATSIFSAVYPILIAPLPYPDAKRIAMIQDFTTEGGPQDVTYGTFLEVKARSRSVESLAGSDRWQPALTGGAEPERLDALYVTAEYLRVLGVSPAVGRDFSADEDVPNGPKVAILSDGLVQRRFGGDRAIVGKTIDLEGDAYTVVGVMPRGFEDVLAPTASVWVPRDFRATTDFNSAEWGHHMRMIGRVRRGVTIDQLRRDVNAIARNPLPDYPRPRWASLKDGMQVNALQDDITQDARPALLAVIGAVILLLTIAAVNVTNLLLARGAQRRGELAMRAALGADRSRIVRQLLTESVILAFVGGVLGVGVAFAGARAIVELSPPGLPRVGAIGVNGAVLAFALGVTTLVGIAMGLAPALSGSRNDLRAGLQLGARTTARSAHVLRRGLVVAQVALALVLLAGAGLLLRSIGRIFSTTPGFDASHLLTMQVEAAGRAYRSDSARSRFFTDALDAVRQVPGVTAAAFTSQLPLSGDFEGYGVAFEARVKGDPTSLDNVIPGLRYAVTPDYFATMRIPLRRGRLLDAHDTRDAPEAVLINESYAKKIFPGQDPIGQRLRVGPEITRNDGKWDIIVGVVGDVKQESLALDAPDAFYVSTDQWWWVDRVQSLVVRTTGDPVALLPAVKRAIWSVDKNQPIIRIATMDRIVAASEAQRRFALVLFEAFALAALALAAIGTYGVLSGGVTERMREIGVRAALGASRADILGLIVRQGLLMTAIGAAIGVLGAIAASRVLVSMLYGISRIDPQTYIGVVALLLAVAAIASWFPAWRAARVDPAITLRAE